MREPRAYLTITAKRLMLDRVRRQRIEEAYLSELAILAEMAPVGFTPDQVLEALQALELISKVIEGVTPKAREAYLVATYGVNNKKNCALRHKLQIYTSQVNHLGADSTSQAATNHSH